MTTKILLYAGTILLYEWIVLLAFIVLNLVLGVINNSTGGRFPPFSMLAFVLNTLPAVAILFLADWIWRITAGCSFPLVILPILAVIHLRNIRAYGANVSNKYQATATIIGIILFVPIYFSMHGVSGATWTGLQSRTLQGPGLPSVDSGGRWRAATVASGVLMLPGPSLTHSRSPARLRPPPF
jgi:hypothetical protein